jgi:hypothetical protein
MVLMIDPNKAATFPSSDSHALAMIVYNLSRHIWHLATAGVQEV